MKTWIILLLFFYTFMGISCQTQEAKAVKKELNPGTNESFGTSIDKATKVATLMTPQAPENSKKINLMEIGRIGSKGRIQDKEYNYNQEVIEKLIALGTECIPILIEFLSDETELPKPVKSLWYKTTVGDLALIILTNFFTDSDWKTATVQGATWDEILETKRSQGLSAEEALREYIHKHGRKGIKAKWERIWEKNKNNLYWDEKNRCFKSRDK